LKSFIIVRLVVALCGVGTTMGVSVLVSNVHGGAVVRVVDWAGPNYAQDVRGFTPVAPSLLLDLTSPVAGRPVVPRASRPAPARPATPAPAVAPSPAESLPDTEIAPPPPPPPTPAPTLAVAMSADKQEVHPNDVVTYSIRVSNTGPGVADGVVVESHVPDGTALVAWECDGATVAADGRDAFTCGPVSSSNTHAARFGLSSLPAGSQVILRFSVRVDRGLKHNTAITNHAHAFASNADLVDSEQVTVIV
jgi:uncharacterized repeat protein (TIGR01451 family)